MSKRRQCWGNPALSLFSFSPNMKDTSMIQKNVVANADDLMDLVSKAITCKVRRYERQTYYRSVVDVELTSDTVEVLVAFAEAVTDIPLMWQQCLEYDTALIYELAKIERLEDIIFRVTYNVYVE